ncbi:MAG: transcription elongation factor GreA [Firmicutes bacterium]|nr:transcription elongation factor GreA [Bacillota bacterium]
MLIEKEVVLTAEGLRRLEAELEHLKTVRRRQVAERIRVAIQFGDLTENSEYEDAKNEQAFIEGRILTLEKMLRNARLLDEVDINPGQVSLGSIVRLRDLLDGSELTYQIVGVAEASPEENRISDRSPVGKTLLGHSVGSVVEIPVPAGIVKYEILEISHQ